MLVWRVKGSQPGSDSLPPGTWISAEGDTQAGAMGAGRRVAGEGVCRPCALPGHMCHALHCEGANGQLATAVEAAQPLA